MHIQGHPQLCQTVLNEKERNKGRPSSSRIQPRGVTKQSMSFRTSITIKQDILESKVRSVWHWLDLNRCRILSKKGNFRLGSLPLLRVFLLWTSISLWLFWSQWSWSGCRWEWWVVRVAQSPLSRRSEKSREINLTQLFCWNILRLETYVRSYRGHPLGGSNLALVAGIIL